MDSLRDHFLLAMPGLRDDNFAHTLTYICEHDENGALGIVINQPLNLSLSDLLRNLEGETTVRQAPDIQVMFGGPVQEDRGFILHSAGRNWDHTMAISSGICLSTSRDVLIAIAESRGPAESLIALGYAGWGAGQLEGELAANAWLSGPACPDIIFRTPAERRLLAAAEHMGIDYRLLSGESGHA